MPNVKITLNDGTTKTVRFEDGFTEADIEEVASQLNANIKPTVEEKKGVDLSPKAIGERIGNALTAPIVAARDDLSLGEAYNKNIKKSEESANKPINKFGNAVSDFALYSSLPILKSAQGAGALAKGGAFLGNAGIQGGIPGLIEGAEQGDALGGAGTGTGVALGVQTALSGVPKFGKYTSQLLNNPTFQKGFSKVEELLTSVPSEMTERALQKELAGNSIFKGKFDSKNLNEAYNEVGQRAIAGMKNAEYLANKEIGDALNSLPANSINAPQLITNITKDIDQLSRGGRINPALAEKGDDILQVLSELGDKGNKTVDFHHIKDNLQTKLRNQYGKESGTGINALKGVSAKIRQALNEASPEYAQANANREALHEIKDSLGGMNRKTIGSNLRNVEGDAKVRAGYSQAAEELENLVASEYKFLDEVKDLRAREALEQWLPGQGGGYGSSQGFGNIARNAIGLGTLPTAAVTLHNPWLILGTPAISPKLGAKTAIQNLGRVNQEAQGWQKLVPGEIKDLLTPILIQAGYGNE